MYTVPEPSNGAPTAMSAEERQNGVLPGDCGPHIFPMLCSSHSAQHGLDLTLPGTAQTIREQSSAAQD